MSSLLDFGQPPDSIQVPPDAGGSGASPGTPNPGTDTASYLKDAIDSLLQFQQEDPDEQDKAQAAKALQIIQSLLAVQQKQQDEAMNLTGAMRQMRKSGA